jgi:diguanylate cyclase (GGDEF)-like protein
MDARTETVTPAQVELKGFNRTLAEIEWLLLVLIVFYLSIAGTGENIIPVMTAAVGYGAFVLVFRYMNVFARESHWKLALETWVMIFVTAFVVWHTGRYGSPLVNLYLLPVIFAGLTLGRMTTLLQVLLITSLYFHSAWSVMGADLFTFARSSAVLFDMMPFLLVAYMTSLLAGDIEFARTFSRQLSETDELTGLPNMRAFNAAVARERARSARNDTPFSILMLDVDDLKVVNDEHGHETGNLLLLNIAAAVQRTIRESDLLARYGGDEFILLLPNADAAVARDTAERIRSSVANMAFDAAGKRISGTVSVGCSTYPETSDSVAVLVNAADQAMYAEKRARDGVSP